MKRTSTLFLLVLAAAQAFSQFSATITITDAGTSAPLESATVWLDGNAQVTDASGEAVFSGLADGTYDYSVSATCYSEGNGSVTIAGADGASALDIAPATTNNVFFFIGSPLALIGATVQLSDGADYNVSFVTWDTFGGEMIGDVPFGEYTYTITTPCYATVTGAVTVDCNNGDGIAVVADPVEANNVFFFVGSLLAITGATVEFTDGMGYDSTFVTWDPFGGEMIADVPFGAYDYTVDIPCYETTSGSFTVDCNQGDGIAVFVDPVAIDIDPSVTMAGTVLTAVAEGMSYQWVDCDNSNEPVTGATTQSFEPLVSGNYAVVITSGNCSVTSACTNVVFTGIDAPGASDGLLVYPVPFSDHIAVRTGALKGSARVQLTGTDGRVLLDGAYIGNELITLDTSMLPSGTYVLRLITADANRSFSVVK